MSILLELKVLDKFSGTFRRLNGFAEKTRRKSDAVAKSINGIEKQLAILEAKKGFSTSKRQIRQFNLEIRSAEKELQRLRNLPPEGLFHRLSKLGGVAKLAFASFSVYGLKNLGKSMIQLGMDAEQAQVAYATLLGDASKAELLLRQIDAFAAKTPFKKTDLTEAGQSLLGFGVKTEELLPVMGRLGDLSMGNANKFKSMVDNLYADPQKDRSLNS